MGVKGLTKSQESKIQQTWIYLRGHPQGMAKLPLNAGSTEER